MIAIMEMGKVKDALSMEYISHLSVAKGSLQCRHLFILGISWVSK
jgi:hypothetical protein